MTPTSQMTGGGVSSLTVTWSLNEHTELYLSAVRLSLLECEAKQEKCTAVSSQTQKEADEEQKREKRERRREGALRSVICTDVAAALGQTLPVFCVHLRLVSPVLL